MPRQDYHYLRHSAVFARVASLGSFRAAAAELSLSPAFVSQLVSELEEHLGAQLLYRSTRSLRLTDAGSRYFAKAETMLSIYDEALAGLSHDRALQGSLVISTATIFARPPFARFVTRFQKAHPLLRLSLRFSDELDEPSQTGIDLALRVGWPDDDPRPARKLFESETMILASPAMAARIEKPQDLAGETWLRPNDHMRAPILKQGDIAIPIEPRASLEANSSEFLQLLCETGAGFLIAPEFAEREALRSARLVRVLPDWRMESVGVYALYSARRARLSNARQFVDALKSLLDGGG